MDDLTLEIEDAAGRRITLTWRAAADLDFEGDEIDLDEMQPIRMHSEPM